MDKPRELVPLDAIASGEPAVASKGARGLAVQDLAIMRFAGSRKSLLSNVLAFYRLPHDRDRRYSPGTTWRV